MSTYADVIVDLSVRSVDRVFAYRVPDHLLDKVFIGCSVKVPFGKGGRLLDAIVVGLSDRAGFDEDRIRDIEEVREEIPGVKSQLIMLADWMHRRYGGTMAQSLRTVMPVKKPVKGLQKVTYILSSRQQAEKFYQEKKDNKRERSRVKMIGAMLEGQDQAITRDKAISGLGISASTISSLLRDGLIRQETEQIYRQAVRERLDGWERVVLNADQRRIADAVIASHRSRSEGSRVPVHLIHGVTGSGKTEIYMELMEEVLRSGQQVILLIPEISLTLQTVSRFYARFGDQIAVMHSRLSGGERWDQFERASKGEASIMIGARSALFTPFDHLGMIIIDEEQDSAYRSEVTPRYQAVETALERARLSGASLVLGSATPSLTTYYNALQGRYFLHTLNHRAKEGSVLPPVDIIDMRSEFRTGNLSILSKSLRQAMQECLADGKQMMLFLNRRGFAGFVSCRDCGYVFKCPHCDVSMTSHGGKKLRCHYCGTERILPDLCPSCGSRHIAAFGIGTQKVEQMLRKEFPQARLLRMDRDTTSGKNDMEQIIRSFAAGEADILIGTQMIIKGHDFPKVTLVGVLAADLSMFSGDYLSGERTFQMLTQAAGRAGRGSDPGRVIIQTYQPDNYCIQAAARQDYQAFYEEEIKFRQAMRYPPCAHMLMITAEGADDEQTAQAMQFARKLAAESDRAAVQVLGPSRASITKIRDLYRYVMYLKCPDDRELIRLRMLIEESLKKAGLDKKIYFSYDMDPISLF